MDKITKRYYERYNEQIEWNTLTHSVLCEMTTALLFKEFNEVNALATQAEQMPAPMRGGFQARAEALIALMVDITALGLTLMLNEPETIQADAEMSEADPDPRDLI
jgi:hypothetical protein